MTTSFNVKPKGFKPTWIVIHHSLTEDGSPKNWDAIRKYHMEVKGWNDIGYTYGLENVNGKLTILEGRQIGEVGAHAFDFNAKSIGICLVGNYDMDPPSDDRLETLSLFCRDLQREFKIPKENVIGHRDTFILRGVPVEKSCPGERFDLKSFRDRLIDV